MKGTLLALAASIGIMCCQSTFAQSTSVPDFNGSWKIQKTEYSNPSMAKAVESFDKGISSELSIVQNATVFIRKVRGTSKGTPFSFERTYYTDGRGETNPIESDPKRSIVSITKLKKRTVVIEGSIIGEDADKKGRLRMEFKLSEDGRKMTERWCSIFKNKDPWGRSLPSLELCTIKTYTRD